jgi:MscS family membrane protein
VPAQTPPGPSTPPAAGRPAEDPLGRSTPRGSVLGFLSAARKGDDELARQYLDTRLRGRDAAELSRQLFVVLDTRLPARLTQLSDEPEGSRAYPLTPHLELVGTIANATGGIEIFVERVDRGSPGPIWLFSDQSLATIPALHKDITDSQSRGFLARLMGDTRVGSARALQWLAVLLALGAFYLLTVLLNRALTTVIRTIVARLFKDQSVLKRDVLPVPARLLVLALTGRWLLSLLPVSLMIRQFWSNATSLLTIAASTWLLVLVNGRVEEYLARRLPGPGVPAAVSLLRLVRRAADALVIFGGLLVTLRHFGVDPTPALAGLGVGGIAVALAAQKTLENVIAGASLIFDRAVRVGDFLRVGTIEGTVDHIGLRSTRIRTLDRTVVSVPNSQIANMSLETFSARDKFWFHPTVGLRYETTPDQLRAVVNGIRQLLREHPSVDGPSVRVRFVRLGAFSLDVEVFAYLYARDWPHFLELQEQLLFGVTDVVTRAGTGIAFPSQTMYVANASEAAPLGDLPTRR